MKFINLESTVKYNLENAAGVEEQIPLFWREGDSY